MEHVQNPFVLWKDKIICEVCRCCGDMDHFDLSVWAFEKVSESDERLLLWDLVSSLSKSAEVEIAYVA